MIPAWGSRSAPAITSAVSLAEAAVNVGLLLRSFCQAEGELAAFGTRRELCEPALRDPVSPRRLAGEIRSLRRNGRS